MTQTGGPVVTLPRALTVRDLSEALHVTNVEIIKELMKRGIMAAINQTVDYDVAADVAQTLGFEVARAGIAVASAPDATPDDQEDEASDLEPRPPVVTVMGHVDHGKTSLLDAIRQTNVTAQEVGAITQHIGAYQVEDKGHKITFIDTPGHEAFTALRARGASVTDIAILVVAADDGIMPQTIEAIDHAKAAKVPIIVAINKMDLPAANPEKVKQELIQQNLVIEEFGGDVIVVPVSAKTREGLDDLLEHINLVAEVAELKANPSRPAEGTVIESEKDPNRGPMATLIVQRGTLRVGEAIVAGASWGRIKAMFNHLGEKITEAGPSTPVEVMGIGTVPRAGDTFAVFSDEREARDLAESRERARDAAESGKTLSLEAISGDIAAGRIKDLNIIIKGDTHGSVEAINTSLLKLGAEDVRVNVIHTAAGNITESDVMLATASRAIVLGFHVKIDPGARRVAATERIDIRLYQIIYELIEDVEKAVKGLMQPVIVEVIDGHAEIRAVFRVRGGRVAGCMITDGIVRRNSLARVLRKGAMVHESRLSSLKRFQEDVREVTTGLECGIGTERFDSFAEGDVIEAFHVEERG
ncbi:MAG: translation initiation factor IF-2 [Dehalococcoidia bacterium]